MAHAYTPGLRVSERATIRRERRLPILGDVLVEKGARVRAEDVVARAELPGDVQTVNVVNQLAIQAGELPSFLIKQPGDGVSRGEVIAETRPWLGLRWLRSVARSPIEGTIETASPVTGQVLIRGLPRPVDVTAYVDGVVVAVREREGVVVEATGAFVQGIFGVGGEVHGELAFVGDRPDAIVGPGDLSAELAGKIVVAGSLVTSEVYQRASAIGIAAIVCGGFHDADLRRLLGYDLGVAITGHEALRPILIMTEGFGPIAIAQTTYELLTGHVGERASANGATQIRAGVLRPEIIIPATGGAPAQEAADQETPALGLTPGCPVRIIREPGFGRIGRVKTLPTGVEPIETEAKVRVVEVEFAGGETAIVPRANVEAIET